MDFNQAKTPYNSIYAELKNPKVEGELVCCSHGKDCTRGKTSAGGGKQQDENQYVNLSSPKKGKKMVERVNQILIEESEAAEQRKAKAELMSLNTFIANNIVETKRTRKERKKKKTPAFVDDNQSYVMLGNTSEDQSQTTSLPLSSAPPPTEVTVVKSKIFSQPQEALSAYIGQLTLSESENRLTRRGEFALYHLVSLDCRLDNLAEGLPLMLIYRTTTKKFRHYPIRSTSDFHFFVDCGYPNVRKHFSLNQLVLYYKTSATCEINPDDTSADSFSWWLE